VTKLIKKRTSFKYQLQFHNLIC